MDPYAQIAAFYEAEYGPLEADAAWFARHAGPGPILVLGCGTGRICRLLGDRAVTGLDLSGPMLAVARAAEPHRRWVEGDMRSFDLGAFQEILVPNAAFTFLPSRADQRRCLDACHRALPAGGILTLDLPMPDFRWLGQAHSPEALGWEGHVEGHAVRRTRETHRYPVAQRLALLDRYYVDGAYFAASPLSLRLVFPAEVEWMLESAGFYVDALLGDYRDAPIREGCPRLLVRAVRV